MYISRLFLFFSRALGIAFLAGLLTHLSATAQTPTAYVSGTVTDPAGAIIPQAIVTLSGDNYPSQTTQTDAQGGYHFDKLTPGIFTISVTADGFADFRSEGISVATGRAVTVNVSMKIQLQEQQVIVADEGIDSSPDKNGGAIIMKGKDLDALSDNPQDLQTQLQAIAGSDPETGTQFFIDGFSGGKLPPKSSIREIRINQNPYSAQYDAPGMGRIEIFTKPGTDKLHGDFYINGNDSSFNSRNPFVQEQPPYHSTYAQGDINGPLNKYISYFLGGSRQNNLSQSFINAIVLDSSFQPQPFIQAVSSPTTSINFDPRFDFQLGKIHTLNLRYSLDRSTQTNSLASQFSLPTQVTTLLKRYSSAIRRHTEREP
jgi:Carboxypeptidase regulatory-like domain